MSTSFEKYTDSDTGNVMSDVEWLDSHFLACFDGYRACVDIGGFEPGMSVLDAGCGPGGYIPWIADKIGASGEIVGLDNDPKNIAETKARIEAWKLPCKGDAIVGDVLNLGFENRFDAIWTANVTELLSDEQVDTMIEGYKKAVKPGGLISIKGFDAQLHRFVPEYIQERQSVVIQALRGKEADHPFAVINHAARRMASLRFIFARHGLTDIVQKDVIIDHCAPLTDLKRAWVTQFIGMYGTLAGDLGLPESELSAWREITDWDNPKNPINTGEFLFSEVSTVCHGRVPA